MCICQICLISFKLDNRPKLTLFRNINFHVAIMNRIGYKVLFLYQHK
uniref:Uncharacterized protein n=1 Tax=Setaria italica TaxID=4555 RepID=K3Y462_SETIT